MNQLTRKLAARAARALLAAMAGAAALTMAASAQAEPQGFLETIKHHTTLINTRAG
ncbi:ABC-type glycerol-3-phosphate transport system substrate-binding protein [Paraburkholderia sp. RAU6.4a]